LGLERVPVHVATDLTPEQVRAYRLADNATGELAEWDYGLLGVELADLEGLGVDLGVIGLGDDVLADLSRQANAAQADANAVEVPAPDPRIAINIRVPAAIWLSKREEMRRLFDQIARTYQAKVQIDE
jgi:ParB-like chromosome segregation protein Spo0J